VNLVTVLQTASLAVLAASFVVAATWRINLGILLLPIAFILGMAGGLTVDAVSAGFPTDIFLLLLGVTYFFTLVEASRTMDYITLGLLRVLGGRMVLVPFAFFGLAALITGIGTFPSAVSALLLPVALRFARDFQVSSLLLGLMVVHGVLAGAYTPLTVYGVFVDGVLVGDGVAPVSLQLFAAHLVINGAVCVAAFLLFGGLDLVRRRRGSDEDPQAEVTASVVTGGSSPQKASTSLTATTLPAPVTTAVGRPTLYQACTIVALVVLVITAVGFGLNIGVVALVLGLTLTLAFGRGASDSIPAMPWSVLVLVIGVLMYVGALTKLGTLEAVSNGIAQIGSPVVSVLVISFITALMSAFASSIGVLAAMQPLASPLVGTDGLTALNVFGPVTVGSTIVDASPMSIAGALVLANADPAERPTLFRQLLLWGLSMIIIGPLLSWCLFTLL
jgi:di/tricarboxylate transporter